MEAWRASRKWSRLAKWRGAAKRKTTTPSGGCAAGASATSIHYDLKSYYVSGRSWAQYESGLIKLDKDGTPVKIMHYGGHGQDHPYYLAGASDGSKVAMAGKFQGNITFGTTTLEPLHGDGQDGYVGVVDSDLDVIWAKSWPLMTTVAEVSYGQANGVGFDASGSSVFASGFQCTPTCNGTVAKFAAADGAWSLELEVLQLISQATPSVALQRLTLRQRSPPGLNVTIAPALSTFGTPVTPCCSG